VIQLNVLITLLLYVNVVSLSSEPSLLYLVQVQCFLLLRKGTCGKEVSGNMPGILMTFGSLSLLFAWRMAPHVKEGEMLSTE
jgi:hypothetical protein